LLTLSQLGHDLAAAAPCDDFELDLAERVAPRRALARSTSRRLMRPCARVRRASTPLRIHTSSCASSLSAAHDGQRLVGELLGLQQLVGG
jgi:hypothetical protein